MRYIGIRDLKPGMKLGADVFDLYGRILLGARAELNADYIKRLKKLGIDGLYISDELSDDIEIEPIISPVLRGRGIECLRNQDIDGCLSVSKDIVSEILDKSTISLDMTDLRENDDVTFTHSMNVALYSCVIGVSMGLKVDDLESLVLAGLLHDIGKLSISPEILKKKGRLTQEEYQIMKTHSKLSYDLIKGRWDVPTQVKIAVLFHHENVDGSGYPKGISGGDQNIFTRILHVADVYDALISKRPYKKPYSPYEAVEYLMGACGIMFDQEVVSVLVKHIPVYPKGTRMELSDGRQCIIVENADYHNLRPVVRLLDGTTIDLMDQKYWNITILRATDLESFMPEEEEERKTMIGDFHRYKILIVDDMITNLQMLRGILDYLFDVTLVKSGKQALAYLKKNDLPDVIIMDIDMPEMDGIETARRIKEKVKKDIPILFVTALADSNTVNECKDLGAAGYIVRPYQSTFIKSEIKRIIIEQGA